MVASDKICARPPTPWAVWVHQIHTARGVGNYATIVVVFVVCLRCVLWYLLVVSLIGCKKVPEHNLKVCISPYSIRLIGIIFTHPRMYHTYNVSNKRGGNNLLIYLCCGQF
jgi:hypothetical protein